MMKFTIKTKIIIWFTVFFAAMTFSIIFFLNSISESVVISEVEAQIKEVTSDAVENLMVLPQGPYYVEDLEDLEELDEDKFEDLEPFQYFMDNVAFVIYENDTIVYGQLPSHLTEVPEIAIQSIEYIDLETEQFLIYDVSIDSTYVLRAIQNITTSENVVSSVINQLLFITPLIILVAGAGGFLIMKSAFTPIKKLYETAEVIKDQKDFSQRVPMSKTKDEIYHLADMMNQMLSSIEVSFEREKQFTSNVSHELRTPLSVLKAQLEYLETSLSTVKQKKEMNDIQKQIQYIEQLVEQILFFSKNESIDDQTFTEVALHETLSAVIETYEEQASKKEIQMTLKGSRHAQVMADEISLIRIFNNLISNAIKYNKKQGLIDVEITTNQHDVKISVFDSGIGMKKEHIAKIFDPFYRVDEARTMDQMSLGIGLSMVDRLVKQHHGTIHVESEYGEYTKITISIPLKKEHQV